MLPVAAGYGLARFAGLSSGPPRLLARCLLLPVLLFLILAAPIAPKASAVAVASGAAMVVLGMGVIALARRANGFTISPSAAIPNVAVFAVPFLKLSWDANGPAIRTAAWMFVGVAITMMLARGRLDVRGWIREPWLYAVVLAIALKVTSVSVPFLVKPVAPLAQAAYPLLLVYLGTLLHPLAIRLDRWTLGTVVVRLVTGIVIVLGANAIIPMPRMAFEAAVIVALAPPTDGPSSLVSNDEVRDPAATNLGTLISAACMVGLLVVDW